MVHSRRAQGKPLPRSECQHQRSPVTRKPSRGYLPRCLVIPGPTRAPVTSVQATSPAAATIPRLGGDGCELGVNNHEPEPPALPAAAHALAQLAGRGLTALGAKDFGLGMLKLRNPHLECICSSFPRSPNSRPQGPPRHLNVRVLSPHRTTRAALA